uniref:Endophilin-B1 n=1 Tax=Poecilia reticulata TaxID=8081 RepID=A0A3P9PF20_POERE
TNAMDFNVKKLASGAGLFFTRAVQYTEEKLGQAERTELDAHFENLMSRADCTKHWTEKIYRQTEYLLQPNPNVWGFKLVRCATVTGKIIYSTQLRLLTDNITNISGFNTKEHLTFLTQRSEHLVCHCIILNKKEVTVGLLYMHNILYLISDHHVCLLPFRLPNAFALNSTHSVAAAAGASDGTESPVETETLKIEEVQAPATGTRKAKVLYDYDAADSSELSLLADELITVYTVPGMDSDWLIGEKGNQKGKVPVTYLELLS